ncbi:DUF3718 domain-containing protein [Colwellia sp. MEBiC06753]
MKKTLLIASLIVTATAASYTPVASANDAALRICEYVAANDKNRLRTFLKQNKLNIRSVFDDISCNDQNLLIFSATNNALEVGEFIIGKTPAKVVTANLEEIAKHSPHLAEAAKKRVE